MKQHEENKARGKAGLGGTKGKRSILNGRALFTYNPDLFVDAENAGTAADYEEEREGDEE